MKQTTLAISLALLACGQVGTTARDLDQEDAGAPVEAVPSMAPDVPPPDERSPDSGASVSILVPVPRLDVEDAPEDDQEDAGAPVDAGAELGEVLDVDAGDAGELLDAGEVLDVDAHAPTDGPATGAALTPEQVAELCALPEPPPEAVPFCP